MLVYSPPTTLSAVPVIDLEGGPASSAEAQHRIAREIRDAGRNIGFFYIVNHGVPDQLVRD